jgi:RNA polymerase sigma-70 factor, ECF subfamily
MLSVPFRFPFRGSLDAPRALQPLDRQAELRFELLVDAHLDAIYRTARRLGVRDDDVEDLVQEVLLVLARRLADIEVDKERAFALGTTARLAAGFRRKAQRRREALVAELDGETDGGSPIVQGSGLSGERHVEQAEALALLRAGLDAMTEAQRVTFVLFELEELRASEIAAELRVAEAAVVSRLHRARAVMRRICERQGRVEKAAITALDAERQP